MALPDFFWGQRFVPGLRFIGDAPLKICNSIKLFPPFVLHPLVIAFVNFNGSSIRRTV